MGAMEISPVINTESGDLSMIFWQNSATLVSDGRWEPSVRPSTKMHSYK
jgi:hypothetical protein